MQHVGAVAPGAVGAGVHFEEEAVGTERPGRPGHGRHELAVASRRTARTAGTLHRMGTIHHHGLRDAQHVGDIAEIDHQIVVTVDIAAFGEPYFRSPRIARLLIGVLHVQPRKELRLFDIHGLARTRGVRKALGTAVDKNGEADSAPAGTNTDGKASQVQDGSIEVGGKTYVIRELASQEMKNSAGATWDAATAGNAIGTWSSSFGDSIDVVVSNNDGMGMSMFNAWSKDNGVPTFGYDANSDAVAAIAEGYGGTISQHADVQAYLTLRVLRNALDGVDVDTGIGTADDAGNVLSSDVYVYKEDERSYYSLNVAVTADNYKDFTDSTVVWEPVSKQLDASAHPTKKVWLNIYNASDNFLSSTYQPLLQKYDDLLNLDVEYIGGDGQTESNITNRLGNPGQYDAFAINMVKTDNAASYTALLNQ